MPCNDGGTMVRDYDLQELYKVREHAKGLQVKLDNVTALLCRLCGNLEERAHSKKLNGIQGMAADLLRDPELSKWWAKHKNWDAERQAQQVAAVELAQKLAARQEFNEVSRAIIQIEALGGVPGAELTKKFNLAREKAYPTKALLQKKFLPKKVARKKK